MANADRISEVYRGEHGLPDLQARSRQRIHWLVAQARGRVLDLGCSQGITSLLLARAGFEVLGVDYEEDRIASARAELARRPPEVQERLEFRVGDATALDLPDASFDTVIFGEVIEHLPDPDAVLREIVRVLKPDGLVVLTTPFGYNPHHDHRHTFYVSSLVEMLAPHLRIDALAIVDNFFRLLAHPGAMPAEDAARLILDNQPEQEAAIEAIQDRDTRLKIRYRRLAGRRRRRLTKARRATNRERRRRRQLQRKVLANRRSRWTRLGRALARARRPRGAVALPLEAARALRKKPLPPRDQRPRKPRSGPEPPALRMVAEAGAGAGELRVDVPEATPLPDGPIARPRLRVATILDRFSSLAFRYEWDQLEIGPDDWQAVLEPDPPDLLFVESAWRGNGDRWARLLVNRPRDHEDPFSDLVAWCRQRSIPTVFWNKEDPPRFSEFVESARLFDHVLTTDSACFGPYQEVLGREQVGALSFGVQPRIHNPVSVPGGRRHPVAFAGSYIAHKHPERRRQMELLLGPARDFGLHIFTRVAAGEAEKFEWPAEYASHVVGSVPYERMVSVYKAYRLFLNVNTVTASPTMCARRIFELSATATPVLSGHSRALETMFGGEIAIARDPGEARELLEALLGDPSAAGLRAHEAMRHVLREHTYGHRVDEILRVAGIDGHARSRPATVSAIALGDGESPPAELLGQLAAQTQTPREVLQTPAAGLAAMADRATGEMLAIVRPGFGYGEHYIEDLATARAYTDASVIGKPAADGTEAHAYTLDLDPAALLISKQLAREIGFDSSAADPVVAFLAACRERGARGYAADRYSFAGKDAARSEAAGLAR